MCLRRDLLLTITKLVNVHRLEYTTKCYWQKLSNLKRDLAGSGDADLLGGLAGAGALLLDGLHDIHALQHLAEHSVLA